MNKHRHYSPTATAVSRPEIQALRAIAVAAVVIYHLWPAALPGGYIGVDVFFAISGFLIIGHLLRDVDRTGQMSIVAFWAKRARRLLPASILVLVATGAAVLLWVPTIQWQQWFREIAASALYLENWQLAADSVDYLGAENVASPVQHFWSLSVEEQLYIVWPLILVGILALCAKNPRRVRPATGVVLGVLTVASFIWSVASVTSGDAAAYFTTTSRAWEFGAGGLLAFFAPQPLPGRMTLRSAVSWAGLAGLTLTLITYSPATAFPGTAALLPVLSTLAIIWGGLPESRWSPTAVMRWQPVQWVGDVSYSVYLWHWPLIVLLPFVLGHPLGWRSLVGVLAVTLVLAWLTKVLVEDPVRQGRFLLARPAWVSIASTLTASAVVIAASGFMYVRTGEAIDDGSAAVIAAVAEPSDCVGAPAALEGCSEPFAVTELTQPTFAATDIGKGVLVTDECKQTLEDAAVIACEIGDVVAPRMTIALVGDSHAGHFLEAFDLFGEQNGVRVVTYLKTWCAGTGGGDVASVSFATPSSVASCAEWGANVQRAILDRSEISGVVYSNFTRAYSQASDVGLGRTVSADDFSSAWGPLQDAGVAVAAMVDIPSAPQDIPACVALHLKEYDPCAFPRAASQLPDADNPMLRAAARDDVEIVDLRDVFCSGEICHGVIGGLIVYFGGHHMTATFSRTLADIAGERVVHALN